MWRMRAKSRKKARSRDKNRRLRRPVPPSAGLLREGRAGTARYYVSDTTESFAQLSDWFLGEYAGGPVTRISVDGYPVEQGAST